MFQLPKKIKFLFEIFDKNLILFFGGWINEVGSHAELRGTVVRAKAIAIYNSMVCSEVRAELFTDPGMCTP